MSALRQRGEEIKNLPMSDSLVAMVELREDPFVTAHASIQMQEIEALNSGSEEDQEFIKAVNDSGAPAIDQLNTLLVEGLFAKGLQNQVRWFWSTGGIRKPYGLIAGTLNVRRSWRYAPTDDLMQALLLVCFTAAQGSRIRQRMPISELLEILRDRFGILIDHPPGTLDSADNRAAAASNFEAFKRRLRLLGCFDGLSDDFSAQYVRNPVETA